MARKKKYTARQLKKKCEEYFDSISYLQKATREVFCGELDAYGHKVMELEPIKNQAGDDIEILCWAELPSLTALCLRLGVNRSTWARWAADEELGDVVEWARATVEHAWEQQLPNKNTQGIIFNLTHNFGWKDRTEISLDEETRNSIKQASMTTEEKEELLKELLEAANGTGQGAAGSAVVERLDENK